jgi:hypothetical protein
LGGFAIAGAGVTANPPKSDDKYAQKSVQLVRVSSFQSDLLQNPYFRGLFQIIKNNKPSKINIFL